MHQVYPAHTFTFGKSQSHTHTLTEKKKLKKKSLMTPFHFSRYSLCRGNRAKVLYRGYIYSRLMWYWSQLIIRYLQADSVTGHTNTAHCQTISNQAKNLLQEWGLFASKQSTLNKLKAAVLKWTTLPTVSEWQIDGKKHLPTRQDLSAHSGRRSN